MKILTLGSATRDIFIDQTTCDTAQIERNKQAGTYLIFKEGTKIEVESIQHYTGGGATNSAVSMQRLGHTTSSCFKVGNDRQGEFIIRTLNHLGVDTRYSLTSTEIETGVSFILSSDSCNSTILTFRGANAHLTIDELPFYALSSFDMLYITSLSGASAHTLLPIVHMAKKLNLKIALNPGSSQLTHGADMLCQALPYVDIFILNKEEAHCLWQTGACQQQNVPFDIATYMNHMRSLGPNIVVVTDGAQGVHALSSDGTFFQPALPTTIVSTLGAGDAFGSCFSSLVLSGIPLRQALRAGALNSSSVISHLDAKTGLLTHEQLQKMLAQS